MLAAHVLPTVTPPWPNPFLIVKDLLEPWRERTFVLSTGCPTKNDTLFWRAVAPLNFELGIKVGGVLESSGSQL